MKKILIFICLLGLISLQKSSAQQTFPAKGAEWFLYSNSQFGIYFTHYKYVKDTVVNSVKYAKVNFALKPKGNTTNPILNGKGFRLITKIGNAVYQLYDNKNELLWKVGNVAGDNFKVDGLDLYVDSTGFENINGKNIKTSYLTLTAINNGNGTCKKPVKLYDNICSDKGFNLLSCDQYCYILDCYKPVLCSYKDDLIGEIKFNAEGNCKSNPLFDSENQFIERKVSIYPNPSNEYINLSYDIEDFVGCELVIRDLQGKIAIKQQLSNNVDVSSFLNGIYYLEMKKEKAVIHREKIMILR